MNTAAPVYDLVIPQGDTLVLPFGLTDGGAPRDLTGYVVRLQVRVTFESTETILDLSSEDVYPAIVIVPLAGTWIATIDGTGLDFDVAVWDMQMEAPDGVITRLVQGSVTLDLEVTQ